VAAPPSSVVQSNTLVMVSLAVPIHVTGLWLTYLWWHAMGLVVQPRGLMGLTRPSPSIVRPTTSFCGFGFAHLVMAPRLVTSAIPITLEASALRSPMTGASPSRQTSWYVCSKEGHAVVLSTIDVPCSVCSRCWLVQWGLGRSPRLTDLLSEGLGRPLCPADLLDGGPSRPLHPTDLLGRGRKEVLWVYTRYPVPGYAIIAPEPRCDHSWSHRGLLSRSWILRCTWALLLDVATEQSIRISWGFTWFARIFRGQFLW
jgi:hypothetical protein